MDGHDAHKQPQRSWGNWIFLGFLAIAAFFLLSEHRAHLLGILPLLLLLACPLLHLFHGSHGGGQEPDNSSDGGRESDKSNNGGHRH